jgi:hypothetical protein
VLPEEVFVKTVLDTQQEYDDPDPEHYELVKLRFL